MTLPKKIRLIRDNLLIGTHVYRTGDVVEVHGDKAKQMIEAEHAVLAGEHEPVTKPGVQRLRSEVIAENASKKAPAVAERTTKQPRAAVAV